MGSDKDRGKREDRFKKAYERIMDKLTDISNKADKHDEKNCGQLDRIEGSILSIDKRIGIPDEEKRQLEEQPVVTSGGERYEQASEELLRKLYERINSLEDSLEARIREKIPACGPSLQSL